MALLMTAETPPGAPGTVTLRSIAVPAFGPTVIAAVGSGAVTPMLVLSALDLGASPSVAALTVGVSLVAELFFAVPAGTLVGRVGERTALMWACAVDALAALVALAAPSLAALFAAVFAMGFTGSVFLVARQAYLIEAVPAAMRARAMSTLGGVNRIGLFVGPFLAAPLVHAHGPRSGFLLAVVAGLAAAALVRFGPDLTAEYDRAERARAPVSTRDVLWSHRRVYLTLGVGVLFIGAARASRAALVPLWAEHVDIAPSTIAVIFGVVGGVEMLLFYPAGSIMDRFGRVWVALPCVLLLGAGMLLLPLTHSVLAVTAAALVAAVGNGIGSGLVMTLGADNAPADARSQFLGGWRFVSVVGASGAPAVIGVITAYASLAVASVAIGVMAVVGAGWLAVWVPAYDPRRPAQS